MNEAPFSSNFVLYRNGLRCQHTVRSTESIEAHVATVDSALAAFQAAGHTITEVGLEEGQESAHADAYVVGKTKEGTLVLWWYAERSKYPLRGGAVYAEHWSGLFFKPDTSKVYTGESRPSPEYAKANGFWIPQKAKIIIKRTGKQTEAGKDKWRFVSAVAEGAALRESAAPQQTAPAAEDSDALCNKIISHLTEKVVTLQNLVDASLRAFARRTTLGDDCWRRVQKNIRSRIVLFFNEMTSDAQREELEAAVRAIGKVLPDGDAEELCREIAATKSSDVPF